MEGFNQERRGIFDGLKVPFDLNAIAFGFAFVVIYKLGIHAIEAGTNEDMIFARALWAILSGIGIGADTINAFAVATGAPVYISEAARAETSLTPVTWLALGVWTLGLWAFFGGAINRIAAMKIAREEGIELKDAARFAASKLAANALTVVFVVAIIGLFYLFFNATVGGWIGRIPYVGDLFVGPLFGLVLISTFFITFALALGILGLNLSTSAIATEASDTFDGVSRAWNYILARPWQVILYYALMFAYVAIFLFFGNWFLRISVESMAVGWWGYGAAPREVEHEVLEPYTLDTGDVRHKAKITTVTVPGKATYLEGRIFGDYTDEKVMFPQPDGRTINVAEHLEGTLTMWAAPWTIGWIWLARHLLYAYLVSYVFSASTLSYFLLRKDVEGDDYSEINLEDEDEDDSFDIGAPPPPPPPPAADAPKDDAGEKKDEAGEKKDDDKGGKKGKGKKGDKVDV